MKAALVVRQILPADEVEANLADMVDWTRRAAREGGQVVCFPEAALTGLVITGESGRDLRLGQEVPGPVTERLGGVAREMGIYLATGLLEREGECLYDAAVVFGPDGEMVLKYRRIQPQWHGREVDPQVYRQGKEIPMVATPWGKMAVAICGDLFDDGIVERIRNLRPEVLLWLVARNFSDGSFDQARWDQEEEPQYIARAAMSGCTTLMVNALEYGPPEMYPSFGGAMVVNSAGKVTARHSVGRPGVLYYEVI